MRAIKFRAWDREEKKLFPIARYDFADNTVYAHLFACEGYLGENLAVMQYIGIEDTKGNEIYEGDILFCKDDDEFSYFNGIVKYDGCTPILLSEDGFIYHIDIVKNSELLGNIYQNSELLKGFETNGIDIVHLDELLENLEMHGIDTSMLNIIESVEENHKMKYTKKPVTIKAIQFTRKNIDKCVDFTQGNLERIMIPKCINGKMTGTIKTLESGHGQIVTEGDFIIKGIQGEFYPCKPNIFYETYEEI